MAMTFHDSVSRELQKPSKLQRLQADYQQKLMKEKEEKLIKLLETEEQKNAQRFRRVTNHERNDSAPMAGSARQFFEHGRAEQPMSAGSSGDAKVKVTIHPTIHKRTLAPLRYGYDKSTPLAPIGNQPETSVFLRKQESLNRMPPGLLQEEHRGAHSDSDLPNPRMNGNYPSNGTYKLSDFQKWKMEQDERDRARQQQSNNSERTDIPEVRRPSEQDIASKYGSHRRAGEQVQGKHEVAPSYGIGGKGSSVGGSQWPETKGDARKANLPTRVPAIKARPAFRQLEDREPSPLGDESDDEPKQREVEREVMIAKLEAEHAQKSKELEEIRRRQEVKVEQKKRLSHVAQQYSSGESAEEDEVDQRPTPPRLPRHDMPRFNGIKPTSQQQPLSLGNKGKTPTKATTAAAPAPQTAAPAPQAVAARHHPEEKQVVDENGVVVTLATCSICERMFAEDRLERHIVVCQKTASKQRKVFDATKQRLAGSGAEKYIGQPKRRETATRPKKDWRKQHEEFINNIRYAKRVTEMEMSGGDPSSLPPPPPSENPDYVKCQHCGRSFDPNVAARHIPKCKDIKHRPAAPPTRRK